MDLPGHLDWKNLTPVKQIGRGGFGSVILHKYVATEDGVKTEKLVAVKKLLDGHIHEKDRKHLQQEAKLLWNLDCEHIISMVGLLCTESEFCVVMEYASNGSCFDFFRHLSEEQRRNIWPVKCRIAKQVIEGMKFLHGRSPKKILHLDLKAANVLLDDKLNAKVCDFGLSQMHTLSALSKSTSVYQKVGDKVGGTTSHIAPEHLRDPNRKPTVKSDTYSFGIFVWELLCDDIPYKNAFNEEALAGAMRNTKNVRPSTDNIPEDAPAFLVEIMSQSWAEEPEQRPTFPMLENMFKNDFEKILPQAERSAQIVLVGQHSAATNDTTFNNHPEISSFSRNQQQIHKLMRSKRHEAADGWMSLHTVEGISKPEANDSDYSSPSSEAATSGSSASSSRTTHDIGQLMRSTTNEDRRDWVSMHTRDEGFAEPGTEPKVLLRPGGSGSGATGSSRRTSREEDTEFGSQTSCESSHLYHSVPNMGSQPLLPGRDGNVRIKNGCCKNNHCKNRPCRGLFAVFAILFLAAAATFVILYFVHDQSFCFMGGNCQNEVTPTAVASAREITCNQSDFAHLKPGMRATCNSSSSGIAQVCLLSCISDFELVGSNLVTCWNGSITSTSSSCRKKVVGCQELTGITHGMKTCSNENNTLRVGDYCRFACVKGFVLSGSSILICTSRGAWSASKPLCTKVAPTKTTPSIQVPCSQHKYIHSKPEMRVTCDSPSPGTAELCQLSCISGFELVGTNHVTCLNGDLSSTTASCRKVVRCRALTNIANGAMTCSVQDGTFRSGDFCRLACNEGYILTGPQILTCTEAGTWSDNTPSCAEAAPKCDVSPLLGGNLICNGLKEARVRNGTVCSIMCDPGYQLVGASERRCLATGDWSATSSRCLRVCKDEAVPDGLEKFNCTQGNLEGSVCFYGCAGKRNMIGPSSRTCQAGGQWSNPYPTCKCPQCKYGLMCNESLNFLDLSIQLNRLTADKSPIQLTYGTHMITCESDVDIWFINYDCTCRDSQDNWDGTCNDYLSRRKACRHAVAHLLRHHVANGMYEAPCDLGQVYSEC